MVPAVLDNLSGQACYNRWIKAGSSPLFGRIVQIA